jgi:hypothetical protein
MSNLLLYTFDRCCSIRWFILEFREDSATASKAIADEVEALYTSFAR